MDWWETRNESRIQPMSISRVAVVLDMTMKCKKSDTCKAKQVQVRQNRNAAPLRSQLKTFNTQLSTQPDIPNKWGKEETSITCPCEGQWILRFSSLEQEDEIHTLPAPLLSYTRCTVP